MSKILIGESSWDSECFEFCFDKLDVSYLHNDFFHSSNKNNTKKINRIKVAIKSLVLSLRAAFRKDEIYFSSLNAEVLIVAYFMRWYKKSFVFLPNVIGEPSFYNSIFNIVLRSYKNRIYVSDIVSNSSLASLSVSLSDKVFNFNLPKKNSVRKFKYIVAFPAAMSHKATNQSADKLYQFSQGIFNTLSDNGLDVYILPHPRDREYILNEIPKKSLVCSESIKSLGDDICYVSACSSLSLNRRYGGKYGCWVSVNGEHGLPHSLESKKSYLVDISYFGDK